MQTTFEAPVCKVTPDLTGQKDLAPVRSFFGETDLANGAALRNVRY